MLASLRVSSWCLRLSRLMALLEEERFVGVGREERSPGGAGDVLELGARSERGFGERADLPAGVTHGKSPNHGIRQAALRLRPLLVREKAGGDHGRTGP